MQAPVAPPFIYILLILLFNNMLPRHKIKQVNMFPFKNGAKAYL